MREPDEGFWLDTDDDRLRRRLRTDRVSDKQPTIKTTEVKETAKPLEISVRVTLPQFAILKKLSQRKVSLRSLVNRALAGTKKRTRTIPKTAWIILAIVALTSVGGGIFYSQQKKVPVAVSPATEVLGQNTVAQKPEFKTIASTSPAATPVTYDAEKKVASFTDTLQNASITISQQPLPDGFEADPAGSVAKLAEQFSASEVITAGEHTAYLGTSAKGPQSVVMQRDGLLIFMFSNKEITAEEWGNYIATFKIR